MLRLILVCAVLISCLPRHHSFCWDWWNNCKKTTKWDNGLNSFRFKRPGQGKIWKTPLGIHNEIHKLLHKQRNPFAKQRKATPSVDAHGCSSYPCLVFEDNFDRLNFDVWEHEITAGGGGNWEFQYYTNNRSNSYVKDGILYIKPTLTSEMFGEDFLSSGQLDLLGSSHADTCTGPKWYGCQRTGSADNIINPIQSARLRSTRGFNFRYGKLEVEAQMPVGDWLWPAIWLLPQWNAYGGWPASGEIDLVESRGNRNLYDSSGKSAGVDTMGSTMHFGPNWEHNAWDKAHATKHAKTGTFGDSFHKYMLDWTSDALRFYVDGEKILTVDPGREGFWKFGNFSPTGYQNPWRGASKMAPFDEKFYIIMNVAVGGMNYFNDLNNTDYPKPWMGASQTDFYSAKDKWYPTWNPEVREGEDAALKVNYVKVWKTCADQF